MRNSIDSEVAFQLYNRQIALSYDIRVCGVRDGDVNVGHCDGGDEMAPLLLPLLPLLLHDLLQCVCGVAVAVAVAVAAAVVGVGVGRYVDVQHFDGVVAVAAVIVGDFSLFLCLFSPFPSLCPFPFQ